MWQGELAKRCWIWLTFVCEWLWDAAVSQRGMFELKAPFKIPPCFPKWGRVSSGRQHRMAACPTELRLLCSRALQTPGELLAGSGLQTAHPARGLDNKDFWCSLHWPASLFCSGCTTDCTKHLRKGVSREVIFIELTSSTTSRKIFIWRKTAFTLLTPKTLLPFSLAVDRTLNRLVIFSYYTTCTGFYKACIY